MTSQSVSRRTALLTLGAEMVVALTGLLVTISTPGTVEGFGADRACKGLIDVLFLFMPQQSIFRLK